MNICTDCFLKMYQSEFNELSKIKGGKKINKIPLGSVLDIYWMDSPMMPVWGEKYPSPILIKNNVGAYGNEL